MIFMEPYTMNTFRDFTEIGLGVTFAGLGIAAAFTGATIIYLAFRNYRQKENEESSYKLGKRM